jgi:hypothetical protein
MRPKRLVGGQTARRPQHHQNDEFPRGRMASGSRESAAYRPAHARSVARMWVAVETVAATRVIAKRRAGVAVPRITRKPTIPAQMRRATDNNPSPIKIRRMASVAPGGRTGHGSLPARGTSARTVRGIARGRSSTEPWARPSGPSYTGQFGWRPQYLHATVRGSETCSPSRTSKRHAAKMAGDSTAETTYRCQSGTVWRQRIRRPHHARLSRALSRLHPRLVEVGVSRARRRVAPAPRNSITRSRKAPGTSVSKAMMDPWSSKPKANELIP